MLYQFLIQSRQWSRAQTDTKTRILDTTWKLLESGNKNVRMSDIAKAVGISRQALYLHYPNRADLLVATTRHVDSVKDIDGRLAESRAAKTGKDRLSAFIHAWIGYIPEIHGTSVALRAMQATDTEAAAAWNDRMQAMRHGCAAAVKAIKADGQLLPHLTEDTATDLLWMILSVENWERLVRDCGWSQAEYESTIQALAQKSLMG